MVISKAVQMLITEAKSRRLTEASIIFYQREYDALVSFLKDADLDDITVHDLRAYLAHVSARSAPNAFKIIRRLFKFLIAEEVIARNPAAKLQRPKVQKLVTKPLTQEQVKLCYDTARRWHGYLGVRDGAIFALMVSTGIRREELRLLKDDGVNFDDDTILVNGKGQKQRTIPITPKLKRILFRYKMMREDTRVYGPRSAGAAGGSRPGPRKL